MKRRPIRDHTELEVYQLAFRAAMAIFRASREFPMEERYSMTDQIRRSSRSVCSNLAEAWRKRRYRAAFLAKLNDVEAEAAEVQTWLEFSSECRYISRSDANRLKDCYDTILGKLVTMIRNPDPWVMSS